MGNSFLIVKYQESMGSTILGSKFVSCLITMALRLQVTLSLPFLMSLLFVNQEIFSDIIKID